MKQEVGQIYSDFSAAASFIEPEILETDSDVILDFITQDERLTEYDFYLKDLIRQRNHVRSDEVEKVIAQASLMSGNASSIYSIFSNADFPYPKIKLSTGEEATLNTANFALHRASRNRDDRKLVFQSFFEKQGQFERTFGTQLYGHLRSEEHTSELQSRGHLVCRLLLEK